MENEEDVYMYLRVVIVKTVVSDIGKSRGQNGMLHAANRGVLLFKLWI